MKKTLWLICLSVFMASVSFAAVGAEEKAPEMKPEVVKTMDAKEQAAFAKKVDLFIEAASLGENMKDPLILVSAVKMLDDLPFDGIAKPGSTEKNPTRFERKALLDQAKKYAAGDSELLAVIAKVETPPQKTAVRGQHGGYHDRYYDRGNYRDRYNYYEPRNYKRHYGCTWFQNCRHGGCKMVCR
ncbi:MAG: hypothetical protein WCG31_09515 [Deltaproteobacteria bacterium]|jgi:hypothetical protein